MKYIYISACITGKTWMYEEIKQQGRKRVVSTYHAELIDDIKGSKFSFAVTRDSALVVFEKRVRRFTRGGECPPHVDCQPYRGRADILPRNGWSIRVYNEHLRASNALFGTQSLQRTDILIHSGPASGLGCFVVAGGTKGFAKFRSTFEQHIGADEEIYIFVEPRPESHHTKHLSR